jgi:hypothetical protein
MLRRLFTLLSALSLVLCVAACVIWIRSYSRDDTFEWRDRGVNPAPPGNGWYRYIWGESACGLFRLQSYRQSYTEEQTSFLLMNPCAQPVHALMSNPVGTRQWPAGTFYGFSYTRTLDKGSTLIAGGCVLCGYDLRATPERCPECGTVPKKI